MPLAGKGNVMDNKQKETVIKAIRKASAALDAQEAALLAHDKEELDRQCAEYGRYCELFGRAMGISEEQFNSLVLDFREHQRTSE